MLLRLITVDPAHFHAALIHKEMSPAINPRVNIFAPAGPELDAHMAHLHRFNHRPQAPTDWQLDVHARPDFLPAMLQNPPGNAVVLAGRHRTKIDTMLACVDAGLHVLADKPWIIRLEDVAKLELLLDRATSSDLVIFDMLTERYEITSILQRCLRRDPEIFGTLIVGDEVHPAVAMASVHAIRKSVGGVPLRRPRSFFDIEQHGEGLADVGTHLVDLSLWMIAPEEAIDVRRDVVIHDADRWPTRLTAEELTSVTGVTAPSGPFDYWCNNRVSYSVRGHRVSLDVRWELAPATGDSHHATLRGTRATLTVAQDHEHPSMPQLHVLPVRPRERRMIGDALARRLKELWADFAGIDIVEDDDGFRLQIPTGLRDGHEAHFASVVGRFVQAVNDRASWPAWELPNALARYFITTAGVARANRSIPPDSRIAG